MAPVLVQPWAKLVTLATVASIVALVVDVDDVEPGAVVSAALDLDAVPSRVVRTSTGAHAHFDLTDPVVLQRRRGDIVPASAALLAWATETLSRLTAALGGDPSSVCPWAFRRKPTPGNTFFASDKAWTLTELSELRGLRTISQAPTHGGALRDMLRDAKRYGLAVFDRHMGTPEGERNSVCWRLAVAGLLLTRGDVDEAGRRLRAWALSCGYPLEEAGAVLRWAVRSRVVRGAAARDWQWGGHTHRLDRATQAAVASAYASVAAEERVKACIAGMKTEGRTPTVKGVAALTGARREVVRRVFDQYPEML